MFSWNSPISYSVFYFSWKYGIVKMLWMPFHIFLSIKALSWSLQTVKWYFKSQRKCAEWKFNMASLSIWSVIMSLISVSQQFNLSDLLFCTVLLFSSYCLNFLSIYPSSFPSLILSISLCQTVFSVIAKARFSITIAGI